MAITTALMAPTMPELNTLPSIGNLRAALERDARTTTTTTTTAGIPPEAKVILDWNGPIAYWAAIAAAAAERQAEEANEKSGKSILDRKAKLSRASRLLKGLLRKNKK